MRFSLTTDYTDKYNSEYVKALIRREARKYILLAPMLSTEVALNRYFTSKFKQPFKRVCLMVLSNCLISIDKNNEITITFKTQKADQLAELITFGNGLIMGCDILTNAFKVLQKES